MNTQTLNLAPITDLFERSISQLKKLVSKKKTLCETLQDNLTEDEFKNVCKYITVAESYLPCDSVCAALLTFNWSATSEGRQYWNNIYMRFEK